MILTNIQTNRSIYIRDKDISVVQHLSNMFKAQDENRYTSITLKSGITYQVIEGIEYVLAKLDWV